MRLREVARTFLALLVGHVLAKALTLASGSVIGRALGPADLGIYGASLTCISYLLVLSNLGQDANGIRLVSQDPGIANHIRRSVLSIRLAIGVVLAAVAVAVSAAEHWPLRVILPLSLSIIVYAARSDWLLLAQGRASAVSAASVTREIVFLLLLVLAVRRFPNIGTVALCYLGAEVVWSILTQVLAGSQATSKPGPAALTLARQGWPIAVLGTMSLTYSKIDTPLLAAMKGAETAGTYYSAYTLMFAVMGFAALFFKSALPEMSRSGKEGVGAIAASARRLALLAGLAGGCATVLLAGSAAFLIRAIYGAPFLGGAEALKILALCLPLHFASGILLNGLVASGRRKPIAIGSTIAASVNVALNLILIPRFGMPGAAVATVSSEATLLVAGVLGIYGLRGLRHVGAWLLFIGGLAAGAVLATKALLHGDGPAQSAAGLLLYAAVTWPLARMVLRLRNPQASHA